MSALLSEADVLAASVPYKIDHRPQVYFLIHGDRVVYVGKSVRAGVRIATHANDGKAFDRVMTIDCESVEQMDALEFAYICRLEPPLNSALHPVPGFIVLDRARREYGFSRLHLKKARRDGRVQPVYEGRFGTWLTVADAQLLGEIARGA